MRNMKPELSVFSLLNCTIIYYFILATILGVSCFLSFWVSLGNYMCLIWRILLMWLLLRQANYWSSCSNRLLIKSKTETELILKYKYYKRNLINGIKSVDLILTCFTRLMSRRFLWFIRLSILTICRLFESNLCQE